MPETFSIQNNTKGKLPRLPFAAIKNKVLGKTYDLSLVFVTPKESQKIHRTYRNKDKPTNVLSFELTKDSGEIIICPAYSKDEGIGFLFIHGLMHLKGYEHGSTMEREEQKIRKQFSI